MDVEDVVHAEFDGVDVGDDFLELVGRYSAFGEVESYGFADIRAMRKGLVARVENMCGKLEPLTKESE